MTLKYCLYQGAVREAVWMYACTAHACVWREADSQRLQFVLEIWLNATVGFWFVSLCKCIASCLTLKLETTEQASSREDGCRARESKVSWEPTNMSWNPQGQTATFLSSHYPWLWLHSYPTAVGAFSQGAAATAAKSLQSCPTLCNPVDGSPPGSPVPGILQARTLEWVAISFSNAWKWKVKVKSLSRVWLLVTPWTAAYQAPPSLGFSRREHWSGVPLPSPSVKGLNTSKWSRSQIC